jgi:hypothetical protein
MPQLVATHVALALMLFSPAFASAQVVVGQHDDFQDGTTDGWRQGAQATAPYAPVNVATGGPAGAGDMFMQFGSKGGSGANSLLTVLNTAQWGSFIVVTYDPAVTGMAVDLKNLGATALNVRFAFRDVNSNEYCTADFPLPVDAAWHHTIFSLTNANMTQVNGASQPFDVALASGVLQARIISAVNPSFDGDPIIATLGVDNIAAVSAVPEPGSLMLLAVAGITAGAWRRVKAGRGIRG